MKKVLFLDIDGVLHPESGDPDMQFCFMTNFCEAVQSAPLSPNLSIVISSLWRATVPLEEIKQHFPEPVRGQIIGVTPDLDLSFDDPIGSRQKEIEYWMSQHAPLGEWLAIDDRENLFSPDCPHLFLVPQYRKGCGAGLNSAVAIEFGKRLQEFMHDGRTK